MTTPDPRTQTVDVIDQQQTAVSRCLIAIARSLDWPCDCGGPSSECTKDKDGNCG